MTECMNTLELLRNGELGGAKHIRLNGGLRLFPSELYALSESVEVIDLCDNQLASLPSDMGRFTKLKAIFLFNNRFESIPQVLCDCPALDVYGFRNNQIRKIEPKELPRNLRWLILTGNNISQIPYGLGRLQKLQKLMLAGNPLMALPEDMADCSSLELLRISANQLMQLPSWLFEMPALTWLAYAGNPFCEQLERNIPAPHSIDWQDIHLQNELGQGASGVIYKTDWHTKNGETKEVAVKMFKGEMTSDGYPTDERDACILAGQHARLVPLLGAVANHPEQKSGLVLGLIPPHFKNMAGPPSLESCTRDTYPADTAFSIDTIIKITAAMASVCQHLHSRGILHGDFYPHNILIDDQGESLLTDFGAASFFDTDNKQHALSFERMEVRALGLSLDDMLRHCVKQDIDKKQECYTELCHLRDSCISKYLKKRPTLTNIQESMTRLARIAKTRSKKTNS